MNAGCDVGRDYWCNIVNFELILDGGGMEGG